MANLPTTEGYLYTPDGTEIFYPKTTTKQVYHTKGDGSMERLDNVIDDLSTDLMLKEVTYSVNNGTSGGSCFRIGKLLIISVTMTPSNLSQPIEIAFDGVAFRTASPFAINYGGWDYSVQKQISCAVYDNKVRFNDVTLPYINFNQVMALQ